VDKIQYIEEVGYFLDQHIYDIFLMDISNISIGECLPIIRRLRFFDTQIMVISDRVSDKWHRNALNMGVSGIFSEPINPAVLENVMDNCAKIRGYRATGTACPAGLNRHADVKRVENLITGHAIEF
jgi:DNA-binding response OmpR family regulator